MGSVSFALLLAELTLTTGILHLLLSVLVGLVSPSLAPGLMNSCAVGFSGVLFALKSVLSSRPEAAWSEVHGVRLPGKYVAWAELFLVQLLLPDASFLGHLAGILAGLAHLWLASKLRGGEPQSRPREPLFQTRSRRAQAEGRAARAPPPAVKV